MKLVTFRVVVIFSLVVILGGCSGHFSTLPISIIQEQIDISNLEDAERCDRIHIDFRKECRKNIVKKQEETNKLAKRMQRKYRNE